MAWTLLKQSYLSFPPHPLFDTHVYDSPGTCGPEVSHASGPDIYSDACLVQ